MALVVLRILPLVFASLAAVGYCYGPVRGFDENRRNFYQHEAQLIATGKVLAPSKPQAVRIGFFDAHWHGLTIESFLSEARRMQCDVLIARGIPEPLQDERQLVSQLTRGGFGSGAVVRNPEAALGSGIVIGVATPLSISSSQPISCEGTTAAYEMVITNGAKKTSINVIFLTVSSFDRDLRLRQLEAVRRHIKQLQEADQQRVAVVGSLQSDARESSREMRALVGSYEADGNLRSAFSLLEQATPAYTSWYGDYTDTVLLSPALKSTLKDVQVVHSSQADSLPIFFDIDPAAFNLGRSALVGGRSRQSAASLAAKPEPAKGKEPARRKEPAKEKDSAKEQGAPQGRTTPSQARKPAKNDTKAMSSALISHRHLWQRLSRDWRLFFGVAALIFIIFVVICVIYSVRRRSVCRSKGRIQSTGHAFGDSDLKLERQSGEESAAVSEQYSCEKC